MSAHNTLKLKIGPKNLPALTAEQRERLKVIVAMPDTEIDYSDILRQIRKVE